MTVISFEMVNHSLQLDGKEFFFLQKIPFYEQKNYPKGTV